MRVIANRQLTGDYGTVIAGEEFDLADAIAAQLLARGAVRRSEAPQVLYETKVVFPETPEGVSPFCSRHVPLSHPAEAPLAAASDTELPEPDLPASGAANPGGRRRRKGSGAE